MGRKSPNIARNGGASEDLTAGSSTKLTTSGGLRTGNSSPPLAEPQPNPLIAAWISQILAEGVEAVHVFCDTDEAELVYSIGQNNVPVSIGSRNFIILEIPNHPMDGPGYRVFSRGK